MVHPIGTLGPRRRSRQAPSGNAAGSSYPRLPPPPRPRELASACSPGFHCENIVSRGLTNGEESPPHTLSLRNNYPLRLIAPYATPRTPLALPPPWLAVAPARPIVEPPWRAPSPAPATATATVPDPGPRLTPGATLRRRRWLFRRGASPTSGRRLCTALHGLPHHGVTVPTLVNCRNLQRVEVQMILKEPHARAA